MPTEEQKEQEFNDSCKDTMTKLSEEAKDNFYKEKGYGKSEAKSIDATKDERTVNNTMRHQYRVLSDVEKINMTVIKDLGLNFLTQIDKMGNKREYSIAKTKVEEAVMWAVKGLTQ